MLQGNAAILNLFNFPLLDVYFKVKHLCYLHYFLIAISLFIAVFLLLSCCVPRNTNMEVNGCFTASMAQLNALEI